jgi:hypothetical protein
MDTHCYVEVESPEEEESPGERKKKSPFL